MIWEQNLSPCRELIFLNRKGGGGGVEAYVTAEANVAASSNQSVDVVREAKFTVEAAKDKQFFFDDNSGALALPFTFAFLPFNDDEVGLCS